MIMLKIVGKKMQDRIILRNRTCEIEVNSVLSSTHLIGDQTYHY
jgi:hypothetical protein